MASGTNFGAQAGNTSRSHSQFRHFFPAWNDGLLSLLATNCSGILQTYNDPHDQRRDTTYRVISCLLAQVPNYRMAEMAVSSVVLGITPTLIMTLGMTTTEISVISLRRPVLAFLLSIGSPAIRSQRSSLYSKELVELQDRESWYPDFLRQRRGAWGINRIISLAEYLLVLATVVNTGTLAYQLGYWTVSAIAVGETWLPALWTYITFIIHFAGVIAFRLRVRTCQAENKSTESSLSILQLLSQELTPLSSQPRLILKLREQNLFCNILIWLLYVGVSVHMLFGTLLLGSVLFISALDAVVIASRYILGALACQLVTDFELSGLLQAGLQVEGAKRNEKAMKSPPIELSDHVEQVASKEGKSSREIAPL